MKRLSITLLSLTLILYLLLFPSSAIASSIQGIRLWFHTLVPTLLPFMILSGILIQTGFLPSGLSLPFLSPTGSYAYLLGLFCGFPMGAKLTADLYRSRQISRQEANYLLMIANNPSPMFINGYLLHQLLHADYLKTASFVALASSHILCCLLFFPRQGMSASSTLKKEVPPIPFSELLDTSIMNGFESITRLGGYIILFSLIIGILEKILPHTLPGCLVMAISEISAGSAKITSLQLDLSVTFPIVTALASFGGISCIFQTSGMIRGTDLSLLSYSLAKVFNASLTFVLCRLLFVVIKL